MVEARRPPKMMALMGTPAGSSQNLERAGLLVAGAVKRALGCDAFSPELGSQGRPFQSVSSVGTGPSRPSHQTPPSGVLATLVKMVSCEMVFTALGFDSMLVPGATPKYPASGLMA